MKVSDIATVILVAVISTVAAALTVNAILGDPNEESVVIKYMDVVQPTVAEPDAEVFNPEAVNPTVEVYVGKCENGQTWNEETQECFNAEAEEGDPGIPEYNPTQE